MSVRKKHVSPLDSLDTLIMKRGLSSSLEFIRTTRAKTRMPKFDSIVTLNRQAFPTAILAAVQESVDGVFEMKVQEEQTGLRRYLRVDFKGMIKTAKGKQ